MSAFAKFEQQPQENLEEPRNDGFDHIVPSLEPRPDDYWQTLETTYQNLDSGTIKFIVHDLHQILSNLDSANQINTEDLKRLSEILQQFKIPTNIIENICHEFSMERPAESWAIYTKWLTRNNVTEIGIAERELDPTESQTHINRLISEIGAKFTLSKLTRIEENKQLLEEIFSVEKNSFSPNHRQAVVALRSFYRDSIFGPNEYSKQIRDLLLLTKDQKTTEPQVMLLKGILSAFFEHTDQSKVSAKSNSGWNNLSSSQITQTQINFLRFYSKGTHQFMPDTHGNKDEITTSKPLMGSNLTRQNKENLLIYLSSLLAQEDQELLGVSPIVKIKQLIQTAWYKLIFGDYAPPVITDAKAYDRYHKELSSSAEFLEHEMIRRGLKEVGGAVTSNNI